MPQQPCRVVGLDVRSHRHALRCDAEGTCARHGSSAAARSALVISAHGNEVYGCCWVNASGLVTSRTTAAHCRLSGHHSARGGRYGLQTSHAAAARDATSSTAWRATSAPAEVERAVGSSVGGGGEQWARGGGDRVAPPRQSSSRRPRSRCTPGGCSEHARRMDAAPPPPVAAPHANRRLGDRGRRKLGRLTVVAGRPVAGGGPRGRKHGAVTGTSQHRPRLGRCER